MQLVYGFRKAFTQAVYGCYTVVQQEGLFVGRVLNGLEKVL